MPVIEFENLKKSYGLVDVIHDLNLTMNDNEFTVFVGPSGCGKSTTLRMIAGLETVSNGKITMNGKNISHLEPTDRDISMVFQDYALYPHMNVEKNMSFGLRLAKYPKDEIKKRVTQSAEMLGLTPLLGRKPGELSGGQRQRVAMGRALVRDSSTLLMDEPLSNLDAKLRGQMRAELSLMRNKIDKNIIYVTHDQVEAMTLGDRIVVMHDGYIQQHGSPQELFKKPCNKFVAGFIGSPSMNFLSATLLEKNGKHYGIIGEDEFELPTIEKIHLLPSNGEIILGIRPSDFEACDNASKRDNNLRIPVLVSEYIGSKTIIISDYQNSRISVELNRQEFIPTQETLSFWVKPENIYVFDRKSEIAIY